MSYNELRVWETADFPIELYHVDKLDSRYEMVSHWHTELEIIRILEGRLDVRLNNHAYKAEVGDILCVNPETVHGAIPEECVYECLDFDLAFLSVACDGCRYFLEGIVSNEYMLPEYLNESYGEMYWSINRVFDTMAKRSAGYKFKTIGGLYEWFGEIAESGEYSHISGASAIAENRNMTKLKNVLSYIRTNYDAQISLGDMAKAVDMSPKYLCYFFKEMTGKSPVEYLNTYRIEKASRKLMNLDKSVTEIAFACGFNDLSYFIKTFKAHKGITPARFRRGD